MSVTDQHDDDSWGPRVAGTFGELLQGYVPDSNGYRHFLITAPIRERSTRARIRHFDDQCEPTVDPPDRQRALSMLLRLYRHIDVDPSGLRLEIDNSIPVGRGMASSTADIMAVGKAVQHRFPERVFEADLRSFAREIEYGDELLTSGISSCYQRQHQLIRSYATRLELTIVGIDEGYEVSTADLHRRIWENSRDAHEYRRLWTDADEALRLSDPHLLGRVAHRSAEMFNSLNPKDSWTTMNKIKEDVDSLGVVVAHTGSMIGLLFTRSDPRYQDQLHATMRALSSHHHDSTTYCITEGAPNGAGTR